MQYALTIHPTMARALHLGAEDPDLARAWADVGAPDPADGSAPRTGCRVERIARYVRELGIADEQVTVIVPAPANESSLGHLRRVRAWSSLAASLLDLPNVGVVVVRAHGGEGHHVDGGRPQIAPRRRHVALILVEDLDRAVLKAARYARGIDAGTVRAVHAASDPIRANGLIDRWIAFGYLTGIPLDVEECHDRNIERSLRRYVSRFEDEETEVTLIIPRRHFSKRRHLLLHDRTSARIARAFAEEPHVDLVVVPYDVGGHHRTGAPAAAPEPPTVRT